MCDGERPALGLRPPAKPYCPASVLELISVAEQHVLAFHAKIGLPVAQPAEVERERAEVERQVEREAERKGERERGRGRERDGGREGGRERAPGR